MAWPRRTPSPCANTMEQWEFKTVRICFPFTHSQVCHLAVWPIRYFVSERSLIDALAALFQETIWLVDLHS